MDNIIDNNKYQVFLFDSPATLPWSFARHSWFVVNEMGKVSRWEIIVGNRNSGTRWGNVYKDFYKGYLGAEVFPFMGKIFWPARLVASVEGDLAREMIKTINDSGSEYPYSDCYFVLGPNSNTYISWILKTHPEFPGRLSWNSFGKGYVFKHPGC